MKQIPNLFTLSNLVFGCLAIIAVLQPGLIVSPTPEGNELITLPERIFMASMFIGIAAIVDFFDGFLARMMKTAGEMGKQLDSLADVVSFGVAPGMIIYQFLRLSLAQEQGGLEASTLLLLPALLVPAAAAWRLATFNIDPTQQYSFKGVPTPAVGLLVASFPVIFWTEPPAWVVTNFLLNKWFWYALSVVLSYLMVSNVPILSLKFKDYTTKGNLPKIILAVITILSAILFKWLAVPVVFIAYIVLSLALQKRSA
jgi:CDP-diacylglycerol---serine O-phosphatidyltransferase